MKSNGAKCKELSVYCCNKEFDLLKLMKDQNIKRNEKIRCPFCDKVLGTCYN